MSASGQFFALMLVFIGLGWYWLAVVALFCVIATGLAS